MLLFLTVKTDFCKVSLVGLGVTWCRWPCDCVHVCMHQLTISKTEHSHHMDKYVSICDKYISIIVSKKKKKSILA